MPRPTASPRARAAPPPGALLPLALLAAALLLVPVRGPMRTAEDADGVRRRAALLNGYPPSPGTTRLMAGLARGDTLVISRGLTNGYAFLPSIYRILLGREFEAGERGVREAAQGYGALAGRLATAYRERHHQGTLDRIHDNFVALDRPGRARWLWLDRCLAVADTAAGRSRWAECDSLARIAAAGLEALGDDFGAGRALTRAGDARVNLGDPVGGVALARRALGFLERAEAPFEEARTRHNLASACEVLGRYEEADTVLAGVTALLPTIPEPMRGFIETDAKSLEAKLNLDRGRFPEAMRLYEDARRYSRGFGRPEALAEDLRRLAGADAYLGRLHLALARIDSALALARNDVGATQMVGGCLCDRGDILLQLGRPDEADSAFTEAITVFRDLDEPMSLAGALGGKGRVRGLSGDFAGGLTYMAEALALARRHGDARHAGDYLIGEGRLNLECAQYQSAHDRFTEAKEAAEEVGLPDQRLEALLQLGRIERLLDRPASAEARYGEALALARATDRIGAEIEARVRMAELRLVTGRAAAAESAALEAADRARSAGAQGLELEAMALVARARLEANLPAGAHEALQAATAHPSFTAYPLVAFDIAWTAARLARRTSPGVETQRAYALAVARLEEITDRASATELRAGVLNGRYAVYREAVAARLADGDAAGAFELADRARSRALIERLAEPARYRAPVDTTGNSIRAQLSALAAALQAEERGRASAAVMAAFRDRITSTRRALELRLAWRSPGSSAVERRPDADGQSLPALRTHLAPDEAFVEYFEGEHAWLAFVVRADTLRVIQLPGLPPGEILLPRVNAFRHLLENDFLHPQTPSDWETPGATLYEDAWRPLGAALQGVSLAYLAPEGALRALPFAALVAGRSAPGNRPALLMESCATARIPSAAALLAALKREGERGRRSGDWLGVAVAPAGRPTSGSPVEREILGASAAMGYPDPRLLVARGATRLNVEREAPNALWIHFACHAHFLRDAPRQSWLELAPTRFSDGHLDVDAIERLRLRARLVTLSACETALEGGAGNATGEELVGMVRAFLSAGADAVIASLWRVPDEAVPALMTRFYAELDREPDQPARALNRAAVGLLADEHAAGRSGHPFLVTAFCLTGVAN